MQDLLRRMEFYGLSIECGNCIETNREMNGAVKSILLGITWLSHIGNCVMVSAKIHCCAEPTNKEMLQHILRALADRLTYKKIIRKIDLLVLRIFAIKPLASTCSTN